MIFPLSVYAELTDNEDGDCCVISEAERNEFETIFTPGNSYFRSYSSVIEFKMPHPRDFRCQPVSRDIDTNSDGTFEHYRLYSLADCNNEANYVSMVKEQVGGNCTRWSATAAIESAVSVMLDRAKRGADKTDWSPVNLSNSWTTIMTTQAANPNFLRNMSKNGTIPLFYFPFHTPDNANPNTPGETGWEEYWQRILKHKYLSRACKEQTGSDFESSVRNCLIDEAALRQATFVFPIKNDVINISFNGYGDRLGGCVDISDNRRNVACPNRDFGGLFDHIQPDYYNMEQQVKDAIKKGKSVLLRKNAKIEKKTVVDANHPNGLYDYIKYEGAKWNLGGFLSGTVEHRPDYAGINGEYFDFGITHSVLIVGYLENTCWDLNNNGDCDQNEDPNQNEDKNHDGICTPRDCETYNLTYFCGDTNLNEICDPGESCTYTDTNNNGVCDPGENILWDPAACATTTERMQMNGRAFEMQQEFDFFVIKDSAGTRNSQVFKIVAVPSSYNSVLEPGSTQRIIHARTTEWNQVNGQYPYMPNPYPITYLFDGIEFGKMAVNYLNKPIFDGDGNIVFNKGDDFANSDKDGDGFIDLMDNCPDKYNRFQIDSDKDGIGDECDNCPNHSNPMQEDDDGDRVGNACDNCRNVSNKRVVNNSEIVVAQCDANGDGGAICKGFDLFNDENGDWWWQPDHNLNGVGDACDKNGYPEFIEFVEWSEFPTIPAGNSKVEFVDQNSQEEHGYIRKNETLAVTIDMKSTNPTKKDEIATTRYCWLPEWDQDSWGTDGHCTTEEKHKPDFDNCNDTNFGYSHGTEPQPTDSEWNPTWKEFRKSGEFTEIETGKSATIDWDWRYDFIKDNDFFENALTTAPQCENVSLGVCMDENVPKFYYTMSTGVYGGDPNEKYIKNNEINSAFFKNNEKYTRSSRLLLEPVIISYHKEFFMTVFPPKYCHGAPCNFPMEWLHDMIIDRLIHGPLPFEMPITEHYFKNDYGSNLINTGVAFREWNKNALGMPSVVEKSRPLLLLTITKNASGMNEGILAVQNNTIFSLRNIQEAVSSNFTFEIVAMDANSNGDWRTKGILDVSNIPNFMPTVSTYHNRELYVVSKNGGNTAHIYRIDKTDQTTTPQQFINICPLRWIFEPIDLGTIINLSNITLHSVGNSLFALGKSGNVMKIFKLSELNGNPYFEDISGTILPEGRDVYNVEIQDDVLYLAGGAEFGENSADLKTDIWRFTEADGWQLIRNDINMFPVTLRIDFDGDNIILTDRVIRPNGTTNRAIFAADGTGDILIENIPVEGAHIQSYGNYCMKESDSALQGGLEMGGECVPFTHPWYNSFSAGATVYSLDGKSDRLFVGTNNAIKVYDISDPTSPVLVSSFSTSSRVNDLEVYGNALFAATNGGLYKLDASNDTLTQTLFVSAFLNYQYKVEVYNGKLYVGDDNGIKVRDLETLSVLTSVNNGSVLDFAIENGEIGLYKDALFSPVEIRDAETLTLKANEFFGCFEIEVGSSDGRFYLSCDDETYRFEDDGDGGISFTELSGDIRELQDVYTFDGYTYLYDENTIWISTSNDVPAICGNGIVEGDEVCDGGQIDCEELDSNYVSGTATCNSTCDGYNTNNCSDDGW